MSTDKKVQMENTDAATSPTTSSAQATQVSSVRWAGSMSFDFGTKRLQYRAFQLKADAGAIVLGDAVVLRTGRGSSLGVALVQQCWQSTASNVKYGTFSILPAIPGTCGRAVVHSPVPDVVELPLSEVVSKARVEAMPLAPAANDDDVDDLAATDAGVSASAAAQCLHCRLTNAPQRQTILFVSFSEIDRALADCRSSSTQKTNVSRQKVRAGAPVPPLTVAARRPLQEARPSLNRSALRPPPSRNASFQSRGCTNVRSRRARPGVPAVRSSPSAAAAR
jgi:hypothetical protein